MDLFIFILLCVSLGFNVLLFFKLRHTKNLLLNKTIVTRELKKYITSLKL